MKRHLKSWLTDHADDRFVGTLPEVARFALATDAEVKRLKLLLRRLDSEGWTDRVCAGVAAALKKPRSTRSKR